MTDCFHCGLVVPVGSDFHALIADQKRVFCCPGCQAVAQAIDAGGLSGFYQFRTKTSERPDKPANDFAVFDQADVQKEFVRSLDGEQRQVSLLLSGITCAACVWLIEHHLQQMAGIVRVSVNASTHRAQITWLANEQSLSQIMTALAAVGYFPQPATEDLQFQHFQQEQRNALMRLGVAGFGMMQVGMFAVALYAGALQGISETWEAIFRLISFVVATPVVFFSARPFFQGAMRALKNRHLIMDVPVAVAIGGAYCASVWATISSSGEVYFDSVSMFTFLLLWGRYLEMRARHRNSLATGRLAQLLPLTSQRWDESQQCYVSVASKRLQMNDKILVSAGETIPCDGQVFEGKSSVDESLLTGESQAVAKTIGSDVTAGTLNTDSPLQIQVAAIGANTRLSAIEQLVEQALAEKPHHAAVADRLAGYFVAMVLLVSIGVFTVWSAIDPDRAFWITLSVLVVTCPCALSLASPTALTAAVAELRSRGLLITRGHVLETLPTINRVIFDKTGTLTAGEPKVVTVECVAETPAEQVLAIAAALEAGSSHPLAQAFKPYAGRYFAKDQQQVAGKGVEGRINSVTYRLGHLAYVTECLGINVPEKTGEGQWLVLGNDKGLLAWICLNDMLRASASATVNALQTRELDVELLTGDSSAVGSVLAAELNITECRSGVSPDGKLSRLRDLHAQGQGVLMVGDGINDIPVLSGADVSIAMGTATDLAQTRADGILLNGDLTVLNQAFEVALLTRRIIRQNLLWALLYNGLALPLAAVGWVPPYLAALGMSVSSLVVVGNALRIHRQQR